MTAQAPILAADMIERRLEFAALPQGWAAVAAIIFGILVVQFVWLLYRRERRAGASWRVRAILAGLRCAALGVLALVWLEPIIATYIHRESEARTIVLVDASASMGLRDRYAEEREADRAAALASRLPGIEPSNATRAELVAAVLAGEQSGLLRQLAERNSVELYQFGDRLLPLGQVIRDGRFQVAEDKAPSPGDPAKPLASANEGGPVRTRLAQADAPATDLGRAVRQAVEAQAGRPIAAVVVLSDGRFNRGEPPEVVGRYARAKKIPIHAVGVGDASEPRNVAVTAVEAPANVFVNDPFSVTAHLAAQGLTGQPLTVELIEGGTANEPGRPIATRSVSVDATGQVPPVVFTHQLAAAGQIRLQVRALELEGEMLTDDNRRDVTARALENKMRVLMVAGAPAWEYRYVSRLLKRDATVDLSCWLQSADETALPDGNTPLPRFPHTREDLFAYDCIILIDPDPADFTAQWAADVEAMVANHGSGLLYVAGRKNTPRFMRSPETRGLIDLLPVVIDPGDADLILNELGHFQTSAWPLSIPQPVAGHPVLALADTPGESLQVWAQLPGLYWHYPVRRPKPVATVLWRHTNPRMRGSDGGHVLLASQFAGAGRSGFLASDSTWRWRPAGEHQFNRFWIQLLRHLVEGKLLAGQKRGFIQTDREHYAVGEAVSIEARLMDTHYQPMRQAEVALSILREGEADATVALGQQADRPGWYRGRWVPTRTGLYTLGVDLASEPGSPPAAIRRDVRVGQADLEFRQTTLDRDALRSLASQTDEGTYLDLDEAHRLAELIPGRTVSMVLDGERVRLWDRWWTLVLLVALLGLEWALRKRACLL